MTTKERLLTERQLLYEMLRIMRGALPSSITPVWSQKGIRVFSADLERLYARIDEINVELSKVYNEGRVKRP